MMEIKISLEEAIMLAGMKQMRMIAKSNADRELKEEALNAVFSETMKIMDQKGMDE